MRCKCGGLILDNACTDCEAKYNDSLHSKIAAGCVNCGRRAKQCKVPWSRKEVNLCYDCYHKEADKKFNYSNKKLSEYAAYKAKIIEEDILMPMFYDEQPSYKRYAEMPHFEPD